MDETLSLPSNLYSIILASSCSAFIARIPIYPIDLAKATLQSQTAMPYKYNTTYDVLSSSYRSAGIRGLYRGATVAVLGSVPAGCLFFTSYEICKLKMKEKYNFSDNITNFVAGFIAETISCVLWVPIDIFKERMQTQSLLPKELRYSSYSAAVKTVYKESGIRGFYKGFIATLYSFGPFAAVYLMTYEKMKSLVKSQKNDLKLFDFMLCGFIGGGFSAFVTSPLDLIKVRLQVQREGMDFGYKSSLQAAIGIFKNYGIRGMFKGVGARMLFQAPTSALSIGSYEVLKKYLDKSKKI